MLRVMTKLFAFLPSVESISEHTLSTYCMPSIGSSDVYFISVNTHKSSERTLFPPPRPPHGKTVSDAKSASSEFVCSV